MNRRRTITAILLAGAAWMAAGHLRGQGLIRRPLPDLPRLGEGEWTRLTVHCDGLERAALVYRPKSWKPGGPAVLLLHGGTQSMRKIFSASAGGTREWPLLADREGFLLLVPNAVNSSNGDAEGDRQTWNDLRNVAAPHNSDDVAFLVRLLEQVHGQAAYDRERVYVTGASNGGMMTFRLLIERPELFAAGAAFIASLPREEAALRRPAVPTPLLVCNGTDDPLVRWGGGAVAGNRGMTRSVEATVDWWVTANNAQRRPRTDELPDRDPDDGTRIVRSVYPAEESGASVVFLRMQGGGHAMPSISHPLPNSPLVSRLIGTASRDAEGAVLAWEFLRQHRRSPRPDPDSSRIRD